MREQRAGHSTTVVEGLRHEFTVLFRQTLDILLSDACPPPAWRPAALPAANPVAVLITHLCGADTFWVAELAGGRPSARVRRAEFEPDVAARATPESLRELVEKVERAADEVLGELHDVALLEPAERPEPPRSGSGAVDSTAPSSHPLLQTTEAPTRLFCILHAMTHHAHHNGQLALLTRLWQAEGARA